MDFREISSTADRSTILEVVKLDRVKENLRVTHTDEDKTIENKIVAAYHWLNGKGWLRGYWMLEAQFELFTSEIGHTFEIPVRPIVDASSLVLSRLGSDGAYGAVDASSWTFARRDECAIIASLSRSEFRPVRDPHPRAYRLTFKAGHEQPEEVPVGLQESIVLLASHFYMNREATTVEQAVTSVSREIEFGVRDLAGQFRMHLDHS